MEVLEKDCAVVKADDQNITDFDTLYAGLRQTALDMSSTWLAYWRDRADRIQQHLETSNVSDAVLMAAVNEGESILRFLAAVGRTR